MIVIFIASYWGDLKTATLALTGCILQAVPYWLLRRGHLRASSLFLVLSGLCIVTLLATVGQGIRDLAIIAYPIVFIFAGLTLDPALFRLAVGLTLGAVCWLAFGEVNGWFVTQPFYDPSNLAHLIGVTALLILAAFAVELLATNLRKSLKQAQFEISQRKQVEEQLRYQSTHDVLTGIYNRAFFEAELDRFEHSRDLPISIIIADVDQFKVTNDTLGHYIGDNLLQQTAYVLVSAFRKGDVVARIGGDEFAALLPATKLESAEHIMTRIKERLVEYNARHSDLPLQLSLGAATAERDNLIKAFKAADQRMYADKATHKLSKTE